MFNFGISQSYIKQVKGKFPNADFHKNLGKRAARWFIKHPLNLKVVRARTENLSGVHLFDDLKQIINKDSLVCLDAGANIGQTIESLQKVFKNPYPFTGNNRFDFPRGRV